MKSHLVRPVAGLGRLAVPNERHLLLAAHFYRHDRVILCTRQGLWFLDVLNTQAGENVGARQLLQGRRVLVHSEDMPGIVFMPGEPSGRVYLTYEDETSGGGRALCEVKVTPDGQGFPVTYQDYAGIPVAVAEHGGTRGMLCLAGRSLTLCDWLRHRIPMGDGGHLDGMQLGHAYGRVFVCFGTTSEGGRTRWFTVLMDLENRRLADSHVWPSRVCNPVLIGRYLFTIEHVQGDQASGDAAAGATLQLTRREILRPG